MKPTIITTSGRRSWTIVVGLAAALPLLGAAACGGSDGSQSDTLSYEEHVEAAERAEGRAASVETEAEHSVVEVEGRPVDYQGHHERAERHREHAEAHRQAAASLEAADLSACTAAPEAARQTCPFHGAFEMLEAEEVPGGVRVVLETADVELVRSVVACHSAHAAYLGYEGMSECAFYLPDVEVTVELTSAGTTELRLTSEDESAVGAIRDRTVRAWGPGPRLTETDLLWLISDPLR